MDKKMPPYRCPICGGLEVDKELSSGETGISLSRKMVNSIGNVLIPLTTLMLVLVVLSVEKT